MAVTKNATGWLVMVLSCSAIAWECSPRVDVAEDEPGGAGEGGNDASSGATFGGSPSGGSTGSAAAPSFGGKGGSSPGRAGSGGAFDPGAAGDTSVAGSSGSAVCNPGAHHTCNDNPAASALWGRCESDATCTCNAGFVINPQTGKCAPKATPVACALPKESGQCLDAGVLHFYFDVSTGTCEEFRVHCGGQPFNANAFETRDECEASCVKPACDVPFVNGPCDASIPVFSYDAASGACVPQIYGGCGGTPNRFSSASDCEAACVWSAGASPAVTIRGQSCAGFGVSVTAPGDESSFELEGTVLKRTMQWGCGCATRPEFVMMYSAVAPLELRLCHDGSADTCEANCTAELAWDLGAAFEEAGTDEFVFVE